MINMDSLYLSKEDKIKAACVCDELYDVCDEIKFLHDRLLNGEYTSFEKSELLSDLEYAKKTRDNLTNELENIYQKYTGIKR